MYSKNFNVLNALKVANAERCSAFGHELFEWSPPEWGNAVAGETGEMCNLIKKLHRGDAGITTEAIAKEAADVVIYLDLLCQRLKIDLSTAIVDKFNEVSDRIGSEVKIFAIIE